MKKKAKLFTTIASLCMAVALMAFGVYAATNQTLNVTSSVAFNSTTVLVDIKGTVAGAVETVAEYTYTHDATDPNKQPTGWTIGDLTFGETHATITYTIEVTNQSEFAIKVTVTGAPAAIEGQFTVAETGATTASVAKGDKATYTLTMGLSRFDASLAKTAANLVVTAVKAD